MRLANRVFDRIEALPQITIAALNGITRAGAAELTLACDMRIAAEHATFAIPEAKWGGFPGAGAPGPAADDRRPRARAGAHLHGARVRRAAEMERYGLTLETHPREELMPAVAATRRSDRGLRPARHPRREAHRQPALAAGFQPARELSDALRHALEWTNDMAEGQAAILEGRAPRFTGR